MSSPGSISHRATKPLPPPLLVICRNATEAFWNCGGRENLAKHAGFSCLGGGRSGSEERGAAGGSCSFKVEAHAGDEADGDGAAGEAVVVGMG